MDIKKALENLGFTSQEAEVYLALLKVGLSPVGPLIERTGLHREIVYGALKKLAQNKLVQSIEKKNIRHYEITDPNLILAKAKKQAELAQKILPSLKEMYQKPDIIVRIFEGEEGFEEIEKDWAASLKNGQDFFCIGGAGDAWYKVTAKYYKKYHRRLLNRRIHLKTVTYQNEAKDILKYENPQFNLIKVLPDEFRVPSSTVVYADKILIQVFGEQPLGIMIQSPAVSKSYKQYFDILWEMGKDF